MSVVVLMMFGALASGAGPEVERISPGLGQRGASFDLQFEGARFEEGSEFVFYTAGLTCTGVKVESGTSLLATIQAAADCALGNHPFRLRTRQGLSDVRVVRIMPLPLVNEVEPNDAVAEAQAISSGSTVVGVLAGGDVDRFRLTLKKGQRLSAEVEGVRLAARLCDTKLLVHGPDGTLLATVDDTPMAQQDPYLTVIAPADGDYLIEVRPSGADGDDDATYALHMGHFPRPDFVYPPGGPVGAPISLKVRGDAAGEWEETVTLQEPGTIGFYPTQERLTSPTPIPFRTSLFGNVLEQEPNGQPTEAGSSNSLPIAFNGVLGEPGDADHFRFRCEAGATYEFTAFAGQLGSLADTVIELMSAEGALLTSGDDSIGLDSQLEWTCPETADYLLRVFEKRRAGGDRFFYRVEASRVDPTLAAFVPRRDRRTQAGQSINVPQGNRVLSFVAVRRQRWTGAANVSFPELLDGVQVEHGVIGADEYLMPVVFVAADDAPVGGGLVPVLARSDHAGPTIVGELVQPVDLVGASADRLYQGVVLNRLAMAVVERAPYRVRLEEPPTALPRDGSLELIVHVERDEGFDGAIDVAIPFLPAWVDGPEKITIPAGETSGRFALRAHPEAASCTWPTVAEARPAAPNRVAEDRAAAIAAATAAATGTIPDQPGRPRGGAGRRGPTGPDVATQLLPLRIVDSPLTGEIGQLFATPGQTLEMRVPLSKSGDLPAVMTARLEGLPARVEAPPVTISADDAELKMTIRLGDDAPVGEFTTLVCEVTGEWSGHKVAYRLGRGGSLKVVPRGELVVDDAGRPLSPLQLLRQSQPSSAEASANGAGAQ